MKNKKKILLIVVGILLTLGIAIGISYAWWTARATQESVNTIKSDCLKVELIDETSAITIENGYPLTDEEAQELVPYQFTVKNTCNTSITYDVNLEIVEEENRLASEYIAIEFNGGEKKLLNALGIRETTLTNASEGRYLTYGELGPNESQSYTIKLWIDEHVTIEDDAMNKSFISKIVVNASLNQYADYKEGILNGADPVLANGLIPVTIDNKGRVTKVSPKVEWYSYANKEWANAVILTGEDTYQYGEEIPEENIESYFVWVPKYSYQLWDLGNYSGITSIATNKVHTIPIKFGLENTSDAKDGECTTPMTSGASGNCKIGDYMTPPAFITMGTNGLWVGKFETGYKGATSTAEAEVNANDATKVQIKPNVYSWRNINVSNAFYSSYNYQRELDSHMMKNTEWGAVAYLQHSAYGSATSVRINNNSAFITGYAAKNEPTCGYMGNSQACNVYESTALGVDGTSTYNYKNPSSQVASTTRNYTGIYDMSGGTFDMVMGVKGSVTAGSTGFIASNAPATKYYDIYNANSTGDSFQYRILGDATGEFGPFGTTNVSAGFAYPRQSCSWYNNEAYFYYNINNTVVMRGGIYNYGNSGLFFFHTMNSEYHSTIGFRIVLAI